MTEKAKRHLPFLAAAALTACASTPADWRADYYEAETTKPYADVMAELELAITEQNFRITGHNKIGSVIRQRDRIDFPDYDTLQFCNLTLARQMLEIEPAAVAWMPCNVAVRFERGRTRITVHLLPETTQNPSLDDFTRGMNDKLRKIVDFAAEN
ncbi:MULTISPECIES: DUF302 domain-containing protein [Methylococcus]|uniref:DUF302 domain-containing protein n=1 Tax=Methylococcus capsulatus TaxID=414 RepID=A0ABZ2F3S5_METCP|nr:MULTISPECIES: DUF302 domain-containing protein [Methylococcus]MDF9393062.1 DUF302 domain-containing protein [Methylococcus capsulatus]